MSETVAMFEDAKDELSEVKQWAEQRIKAGQYADTTGRFKVSAMLALADVLLESEPRTAQYLQDNLEAITNRWATKNKASGDTPRTYRSRAKGLLTDYLGWKADPSGFKIERTASPRKPRESALETNQHVEKAVSSGHSHDDLVETIRLDGGRLFKFEIGDITMKDAARIAYALAARATDFDPQNVVFRSAGGGNSSSTDVSQR